MARIVAPSRAARRVAGMPIFVTIQPMHRDRRPRPRRGRPARPRDPRPGLRELPGGAVPRHGLRRGRRPGPHQRGLRGRRRRRRGGAGGRRHRARPGLLAAPARARRTPVLEALRAAHARGARMVSICTGAFALAAAGILDGRRATTHWRDAADLAARHRAVRVEPGRALHRRGRGADLGRRRGRAWTSACTSCAATTAPRWPTGSPAASSSPRTATAARPSTSSSPCPSSPAARSPPPAPGRSSACTSRSPSAPSPPTPTSPSAPSPAASAAETGVPGPALAARPARRRRPRRARVHRRLDRRDRRPLRLRHRGEPPQALPPPPRAPPRRPTAARSPT